MSKPSLPFSKIRYIGETAYLSGLLGFNEDRSIPESVAEQTNRIFVQMRAVLEAEGMSLADVVSCTCYLADRKDFAEFNVAYAAALSDPLPVRTTVETPLMIDAKVEITAIARAKNG